MCRYVCLLGLCALECWCPRRSLASSPLELELKPAVSPVMWVLRTKLPFSGRAATAVNCRDNSPAPLDN